MRFASLFLILLIAISPAYAGCDKLITLDDGKGHIFGYVIPSQIVGMGGNTTTTHIVFRNGGSIDVPIDVEYVYGRINQACPQ